MSDRTRSTYSNQRDQKEQVAVALATERLPWHPAIQERFGIERSGWRALVEAVFPAAKTSEGVILALSYCKARNLDPFKRVVHVVPIWDKAQRKYVETVWPGIGEARTTAMRTKLFAGCDETKFGPDMTQTWTIPGDDDDGRGNSKAPRDITITFPEWAQVTVYRKMGDERWGVPGPRVYWLETFSARGRLQVPNDMWIKRPRGQLEKCFGPETEVLTDLGFQRFDAVTGRIMQVTDKGIEATDSRPFRRPWFGPMVYAEGDALNFRVTPNHDMVTTAGKIEAGKMFNQATSIDKFRIPISISGSRPDAGISDRAIALSAMFVCDGWSRPYGAFCISVSRPAKIAAIEALNAHRSVRVIACAGDEAETATRTIVTRADKTAYTFDESTLEGLVDLTKAFDQKALLSLSRRQARLLVDTMLAFDGSDNGRGTRRFYSSRPSILAAFEIAAVAAGYAVSQRRERISDIGGPNFSVTVSDKESLPVLRYSTSQIGKDGSKAGIGLASFNAGGEVWCCTVPSGVIVVRREGLSMLCGNCAEAAALRRAFPEELGDEATADEMGDYSGPTIDQDGNQVAPVADKPPAAAPAREPTPRQSAKATPAARPPVEPQAPPIVDVEPERQPEPIRTADTSPPPAEDPPAAWAPPPEGFGAWIVDQEGVELRPEPYDDPMQFATALATLCAGRPRGVVDDILAINEAAIRDCCDASDDATKIILAITEPPPQDQPAEPSAPPPPVTLDVVPVQSTKGGAPHWPNYAQEVCDRLDKFTSADDAIAWAKAQEPTYMRKSIQAESKISRKLAEVVERLGGKSPAKDADRLAADSIIAEIQKCPDMDAMTALSNRADVLAKLKDWESRRPDLFNEVRAAGTAKKNALG